MKCFVRKCILFFILAVCSAAPQGASVEMLQSLEAFDSQTPVWLAAAFSLQPGESVQANSLHYEDILKIHFDAQENLDSFKIYWPPTETKSLYGQEAAVYDCSFLVPIRLHAKNPKKSLLLKGTVAYVVCGTLCEPRQQTFSLKIPAGVSAYTGAHHRILEALELLEKKDSTSLMFMLGLAVLGGIILNFMPCVLPVLALKFVNILTSKNFRRPRMGFVMTIAGIFVSFWVLGGIMSLLRHFGQEIGWGMHFQQPAFLLFMILLMTVFSLSLLGFFQVRLPRFLQKPIDKFWLSQSSQKLVGHFLTGVFATALATPCTAPFLGAAAGFALTQSVPTILLIFSAIAFGFASPYFVLLSMPLKWLPHPKPGPWMVWVKRMIAACLLVTAGWLSFVWWQQVHPSSFFEGNREGWRRFDPQKIPALVERGNVVVINVTAAWCLTCKVNNIFFKATNLFKNRPNVHLMEADWTRRDGEIANFLQRYNRSGIPFTIIFGPKMPQGLVLPEILTESAVEDALRQAQ